MPTQHNPPSKYPVPRNTWATLVQDDIWGTPLPNGMLRWFGYDFDRVELPDEPILPRYDPPRWVGDLPGFTSTARISDATVTIMVDTFKDQNDPVSQRDEDRVTPQAYLITLNAHGIDDLRAPPLPHLARRTAGMPADRTRPRRHPHRQTQLMPG